MGCTDAVAGRWMEAAITPVLSGNGLGDAFGTLKSLQAIKWTEDSESAGDVRGLPCEACVEGLRDEWEGEAKKIWKEFGQWVEDSMGD